MIKIFGYLIINFAIISLSACGGSGSKTPVKPWKCKTAIQCASIVEKSEPNTCKKLPDPFNENKAIYLRNIDKTKPIQDILVAISQVRIDHASRPPKKETLQPHDKIVKSGKDLYLGCKFVEVPDVEHIKEYSYIKNSACFTDECRDGAKPPGKTNPPPRVRDPGVSCLDECSRGSSRFCVHMDVTGSSAADHVASRVLSDIWASTIMAPLPASVDLSKLFTLAGASQCSHKNGIIDKSMKLESRANDECHIAFDVKKVSRDIEEITIDLPTTVDGNVIRNSKEGRVDFADPATAPLLGYQLVYDPGVAYTETVSTLHFRHMFGRSSASSIIAEGGLAYCFAIDFSPDDVIQ